MAFVDSAVSLPQTGDTTLYLSTLDPELSTTNYLLSVYISNTTEQEAFYLENPPSGLYGSATLLSSAYSTTENYNPSVVVVANLSSPSTYMGGPLDLNKNLGQYQFHFNIPPLGNVTLHVYYVAYNDNKQYVQENVTIVIGNPNGNKIVGDPQFLGLRGQSFQVHGIDGAIYNIISESHTQVNARFVFLAQGTCPIFSGIPDSNCWSHPGSYLGAMSFQQKDEGKIYKALITAGCAKKGFQSIVIEQEELTVGQNRTFGSFSVEVVSTHKVRVLTKSFSFILTNSDFFINQAIVLRVPLSKLNAHGLLGQTHVAKTYLTPIRYIQGRVDDYMIESESIFGNEFVYNLF